VSEPAERVVDVEAEPTTKEGLQQNEELYSIYTHRQKIAIVLVASVSALISPMTQAIYLPALNSMAAELHVSNSLINLTLTSFLVSRLYRVLVPQRY